MEEGETAFEGRGREKLSRGYLSDPRWNCALGSRVTSCSHSHLEGFIANLSVQRQFFPTDEDEMGAAKALMRLQDTYKLDPDTISKGQLPGTLTTSGFAHPCMCVSYGVWIGLEPLPSCGLYPQAHHHCWQ